MLAKVKTAYEAAYPGVSLTISTGSSTALETQIEQGAPADVFLSADMANPQKLVAKGLAAGPAVNFAGNLLAIIVPTANPAGITTPADLAKPGVKIIAAADSVPIAVYAAQLVANLAKQPAYPADFVAAYKPTSYRKRTTSRSWSTKVSLGEGDAGIVYVTDARTTPKVTTIAVPAAANVPATYAGVVVEGTEEPRGGAGIPHLVGRALLVRPSSPRSASCRPVLSGRAVTAERVDGGHEPDHSSGRVGRPDPGVDPSGPSPASARCSSPCRSSRSSSAPSWTDRSPTRSARRSCSMP